MPDQTREEQEQNNKSYRSIFKATSIFGGVQVYKILISIIRSKFVAVLLGPTGMGYIGLYQSAIQMIQSFSSFGLSQSAIRDVSEANGSGDTKRIGLTVSVVKRLVWITGLLGLVVTAVSSPILSKTTFGNYDYTIPFVLLSITLLLDQLSAGQTVVLQGMRKLSFLAKSTAIGSTIGLIVSIPLYYWFGIQGIVPTLILNSLTLLCLTWYFSKKVDIEKNYITNKQTFQYGKTMLKMGIAICISGGIVPMLLSYILRWFIRYESDVSQVGIFSAGFAIVNTYVGLIFNAMATDYYPRLAAVNRDNKQCNSIINQQGEISVLILAPVLVSCIIFMPFVLEIIYSDKFLSANEYIIWSTAGMMFKLLSWLISYFIFAKGETKLFVSNEVITNIYFLLFSILGYHFYKLTGLGMAFLVSYLIYSIQVYLIARKRYGFSFSKSFKKVYSIQILMVIAVFVTVLLCKSNWMYLPTGLVFAVCAVYSLRELDKRMNVVKIIKGRLGR